MQLFLIRHGATELSREFRFCGNTDAPLSREGIHQAQRLRALLRLQKFDGVYSSPQRRAMQTVRIVFPHRKVVFSVALRELDFGELEGLSAADAEKLYPRFYRKWTASPAEADPPGGERIEQCHRRVWNFVRGLTATGAGRRINIALVTHGGPIKLLLSDILGWGLNGLTRLRVEPASVAVIGFDGKNYSLVVKSLFDG
jgi:broad specificity phosphatase PhoE